MIKQFTTGATRHNDPDKLEYEGFLSPIVLEEYARYMHAHRKQADGTLRAPDNWQKGIPQLSYKRSLLRHVWAAWKAWRGYRLEPEMIGGEMRPPTLLECLCGILFNTMGLMHELLLKRDVGASKAEEVGAKENPPRKEGGVAQTTWEALKDYEREYNAKMEQERAIQAPRIWPNAIPMAWSRPQLSADISQCTREEEEAA